MPPAEQPLPEGTDSIIEGAGVGLDEDGLEPGAGAPPQAAAESDEAALSSGFVPRDTPGESQGEGEKGDGAAPEDLRAALFGRFEALRGEAGDRARDYAVAGKDRATAALDDLVRMVEDAAGEVDARLGSQYGDYARRAAESLGGFTQAIKDKDVDDLFADGRALLQRSPAVAVGTAAALGFVVARLVRAGIDSGSAPADKNASAA